MVIAVPSSLLLYCNAIMTLTTKRLPRLHKLEGIVPNKTALTSDSDKLDANLEFNDPFRFSNSLEWLKEVKKALHLQLQF